MATETIRVVTIDNTPWFVASDVLDVLGLVRGGTTLNALDKTEFTTVHKGVVGSHPKGNPLIRVISEYGLFKLVMRSDKPEAKGFQDWGNKVALPANRKDGGYILGERDGGHRYVFSQQKRRFLC